MKKILIYSVAYYPAVGGAEIAVKEITDRISDAEFFMLTVNLDGVQKKYEKVGAIHVYRVGRGTLGKYLFPLLSLPKALMLHRTHRFSAVWSIMANYAGFAALFFTWIRPEVPLVLTLQEGDPIEYIKKRVSIFMPLFKQIFKKAYIVQAISRYLALFGKDMGHEGAVALIPNGVDTSLFSKNYTDHELGTLRWQLHKDAQDIFLITTSRLVKKNGVGDVIRALPMLPSHVKFVIVGIGPLEDELKKMSRELGVESRVVFVGFLSHEAIPPYLKVSDIFIRPSLSEGMGNSFIEAMAAGLPVIATPVGGIIDFVSHSITGIFCEVQNPESIATSVRRLIDDEKLRNTIVSNAKKLVVPQHDWNIIAAQMKGEVFDRI